MAVSRSTEVVNGCTYFSRLDDALTTLDVYGFGPVPDVFWPACGFVTNEFSLSYMACKKTF